MFYEYYDQLIKKISAMEGLSLKKEFFNAY
jgi:hypothetical protein